MHPVPVPSSFYLVPGCNHGRGLVVLVFLPSRLLAFLFPIQQRLWNNQLDKDQQANLVSQVGNQADVIGLRHSYLIDEHVEEPHEHVAFAAQGTHGQNHGLAEHPVDSQGR